LGAYTKDPDGLTRGVENSAFVVTARDDDRLVGLARVLSDDVSIVYVQDVLVDPEYQRNGIGRELLQRCLDRFSHVLKRMLLTDDEAHQHRLYKALGFHDVSRLDGAGLHAFVDIEGADLTSS
jgi:ribosomal protein S18 acetylase RimI-like enzyme